ncbi:MAG: NAD(+)/NADH kinase, partial [Bacteroidota bacterium]
MKKFWDTLLIYARPSIALKLDGLERLVVASKGLPVRLLWHQSLSEALNGLELDVDPQFFDSNEPCPEFIQMRKENTLVLTLGGDGTLLDGIQFAVEWDLPVFGFHFGRLGFLSSAGGTVDFSAVLTAMLNGQLEIESRSLVACKFPLPMKETGMSFALNEMALHRQGAGIMRITCLVNEELLNNYQADGLLVSTPTGSTAYS